MALVLSEHNGWTMPPCSKMDAVCPTGESCTKSHRTGAEHQCEGVQSLLDPGQKQPEDMHRKAKRLNALDKAFAQHSTEKCGKCIVIVQVQDSEAAVIQVTPVSVTLAANAAVEAANPGATAEQLAAAATESGLSYAANGQLNNLYNQVTNAESTEQLLETTAPAAAATFETTVGAPASEYAPIALYDVAASASAEAVIAESGSVQVAISVPGVADGTQVVAICWDRNGNSRTVPVRVVNGVVYLTVYSSGPVMIMARTQVQG